MITIFCSHTFFKNIRSFLEEGISNLELDFSEVVSIDCSSMEKFISLGRMCTNRGGELSIVGASAKILNVVRRADRDSVIALG